jgi:hypothetical protein
MLNIERTITIDAPAHLVWNKISQITDVQDWSSTVNEAHYHTEEQRCVGAGRTCDVVGLGTLVEDVVEWNENESYTVSVKGMPRIVKEARGTWHVQTSGPKTTLVTTKFLVQTRYGFIGALMEKFLLGPNLGKSIEGLQAEFKKHAELGEARPSESA